MASGIWYPDNISRRDRLRGLIDNISNDQRTAAQKYDSIHKAERNMEGALDSIMKKLGLHSLKELNDKIQSELPADVQEKYKEAMKASEKMEQVTDTIVMVSGMIYGAATAVGIVVNAVKFFKTVPIVRGIMQIARGFRVLVTEGLEAGMKIFRTVVKVFSEVAEIGGKLGKVLRIVSKVASIVQYISFGIDLFTIIYQILDEKKQRDDLISAVQTAQPARIAVSYLKDQIEVATQKVDSMDVFLDLYNDGLSNPEDKKLADRMAAKIAEKLQDAMETVSIDGVMEQWKTIDKNNSAYTGADLSDEKLKEKVEQDINDFEKEAKENKDKAEKDKQDTH